MDRRRFLAGLSTLGFAGYASAQDQTAPTRGPDVIFVPTPEEIVDTMMKMAAVTPKDIVYDLGCGDGRIVITAAQKYGARGVGIELDRQLVALATENARKAGVAERVTFRQGDLFQTDLVGPLLREEQERGIDNALAGQRSHFRLHGAAIGSLR